MSKRSLCIVCVVIAALLAPAVAHADAWKQDQASGDVPSARSGNTMVEIDGKLYIFGGQTISSEFLNDLHVYDPLARKWAEELPANSPPPERRGHSAVPYGGQTWVFFGEGASGPRSDIWKYDSAAKSWTEVTPGGGSFPAARTDQSVVLIGDRFYVYGGKDQNGHQRSDLWSCSARDNTWTQEPPGEKPLSGHRAVVVDNKMFVHGGYSGQSLNDRLYTYDPATRQWTTEPLTGNQPPPRAQHIAVRTPVGLMIHGGIGVNGAELNDTWEYDVRPRTWVFRTASGPIVVSAGAAAIRNSNLYTFGGSRGGQPVNETWQYTLPAATEPAARTGHTLTRVGDDVYLFGGQAETTAATAAHGPRAPLALPQNDLWRFGTPAGDWEILAPPDPKPPARFYHGAAGYNGKLYIFFGVDASYSTLSDIWAYDPSVNSWAQQPSVDPPPPRSQFSAVAIGGAIYVWGGLGADFQVITDPFVWRYDLATGNWTQMAGLPPRSGYVAGAVNGKMVVSGGSDDAQYFADAQAFDPVANQWAQVSLSGAALESLAYSAAAVQGNILQIFGGQHRVFSAATLARPAEDETARDTVWELTFDAEVTTATVRQLAPLPARRKYAAAAMLPTATAQAAAGPAASGQPQALLFGGAVNYQYVAATLLYSTGAYTWGGGASADWGTTANWTPVGAPVYGNDVIIPAGSPAYWPTLGSVTTIHALTLGSGARLTIAKGAGLTATGAVVNHGTLTQQAEVNGAAFTFFGTGGYGGLTLNPNGQALGSTVVQIRGNQDCTSVPGETVRRCFDIASGSPPVIGVILTFYFAASEIPAGQSCANVEVYHWDGGWSGPLTRDATYGTDGRDCTAEPYSIRVTGVTAFSPFVLKSGSQPTAMTLRAFRAAPGNAAWRLEVAASWPYAVTGLLLLLGGLALRRARR